MVAGSGMQGGPAGAGKVSAGEWGRDSPGGVVTPCHKQGGGRSLTRVGYMQGANTQLQGFEGGSLLPPCLWGGGVSRAPLVTGGHGGGAGCICGASLLVRGVLWGAGLALLQGLQQGQPRPAGHLPPYPSRGLSLSLLGADPLPPTMCCGWWFCPAGWGGTPHQASGSGRLFCRVGQVSPHKLGGSFSPCPLCPPPSQLGELTPHVSSSCQSPHLPSWG